jgi:hypothetical protein
MRAPFPAMMGNNRTKTYLDVIVNPVYTTIVNADLD